MERKWPGMNAIESTRGVLERAGARLGRPIMGGARGGASDASHFAAGIPITIDGLGSCWSWSWEWWWAWTSHLTPWRLGP